MPRCLITGAAGGLGRAIALALHQRGVELTLVDRDGAAVRAVGAPLGARCLTADLTDDAAAEGLFDEPPEIVVNAIGLGVFGPFETLAPADFARSFDLNFFAPLLVGLTAMRAWIERGIPGRLLTLSSISGYRVYSTSIAYGTAKHALESSMRILRHAGAPHGIAVGTLCPTNVDTGFWQAVEMRAPVDLPKRSQMIDATTVAEAATRWLDRRRPPGVVFVPAPIGRRRIRYGREPARGLPPRPPGVAVVTGASRGLGREIAARLRERGYRLCAVARDAARLAAEFGGDDGVLIQVADVTDRERMAAVLETTAQRFGCVDLLVNNAGSSRIGPPLEIGFADLRRVFDQNVYGYLHPTALALPYLERSGGTLLNVLSTTALDPAPNALPYSCAKIVQAAVSYQLREDLAARGVRVVDLYPGNIRTEFFARAETADGAGVDTPGGAMEVAEVAAAALSLLDGEAETLVIPRNYGRRSPARRVLRVLRRLGGGSAS